MPLVPQLIFCHYLNALIPNNLRSPGSLRFFTTTLSPRRQKTFGKGRIEPGPTLTSCSCHLVYGIDHELEFGSTIEMQILSYADPPPQLLSCFLSISFSIQKYKSDKTGKIWPKDPVSC